MSRRVSQTTGRVTGSMDIKNDERTRRSPRERNPERTTRDILVAAREEFVEHGLDGARIDRIAERAGANKRLIYHYVGNKEELYARVLLDAYRDIREGERKLQLTDLPPEAAMDRLVGFTFDHFAANRWFVRLLANENMHRAAFVSQMPEVTELTSPVIGQLRGVLAAGEAQGIFRKGVDPIQLYMSIIALSYFFFSNIHTLSVVFGHPLDTPESRAERRAHVISVIRSHVSVNDA
jgi:AcrR family transcriptional regulator